ncbi:MAG TPA: alpha-glucan family phosphorylase, partial [Actinomycetales bacterium]|nr:alpha-glucan family phosphorylase [Actinomycetales bacterium]
MRAIRKFTVRPRLPQALRPLETLAHNLRWSWHQPTQRLFADIDSRLWDEVSRDPIAMLGHLPPQRLDALAADSQLVDRVQTAGKELAEYLNGPRWFQQQDYANPPRSIAYFSPEFGITAALPQYSGGLGILAGDHLKSASDLGVPIIGVGLLYGAGYFRQSLTRDGWQAETYPVVDPNSLPLQLLRETDETPSLIKIDLPGGRALHAQVWRADVGRVPLLLLDSNVPANDEQMRRVTDRLYGGGAEHRLRQELLLGIGGVRALRLWERLTDGPAPEVYHTNEGHAGFLGIERIGELMAQGMTFAEGLEAVRAGTVFTTHTPVPAGIDRFDLDLIRQHFTNPGAVAGIDVEDVVALGAENYEGGTPTVFNMAVMGLRLAQRANGVSQLHGAVSREMFAQLWPGFDTSEVPITSVTNGVHSPTWVDPQLTALATERLSVDPLGGASGWEKADSVTDAELWAALRRMRAQLVADVRARLRESWRERGASPAELGWIDEVLSPDVLTIGFARRVPTYKRLTLMLREPARLKAVLLHPEHPVQLIVAG